MISIDEVISQNSTLVITEEGKITYYVIKESLYENTMHLMLSWLERNVFYNTYSISNDEIHTIRNYFGN